MKKDMVILILILIFVLGFLKGSSSSKGSHDKENKSLKNEIGPNEEGLAKRLKLRTNNPGVRVKGARIYDSENGKTCHQVHFF